MIRVINIEQRIRCWVWSLRFRLPISNFQARQHEVSCHLYSLTHLGRQWPAICLWTMRWTTYTGPRVALLDTHARHIIHTITNASQVRKRPDSWPFLANLVRSGDFNINSHVQNHKAQSPNYELIHVFYQDKHDQFFCGRLDPDGLTQKLMASSLPSTG